MRENYVQQMSRVEMMMMIIIFTSDKSLLSKTSLFLCSTTPTGLAQQMWNSLYSWEYLGDSYMQKTVNFTIIPNVNHGTWTRDHSIYLIYMPDKCLQYVKHVTRFVPHHHRNAINHLNFMPLRICRWLFPSKEQSEQ